MCFRVLSRVVTRMAPLCVVAVVVVVLLPLISTDRGRWAMAVKGECLRRARCELTRDRAAADRQRRRRSLEKATVPTGLRADAPVGAGSCGWRVGSDRVWRGWWWKTMARSPAGPRLRYPSALLHLERLDFYIATAGGKML